MPLNNPSGATSINDAVVKTADEIINNSTTLQNDDELKYALEASTVYVIEAYIYCVAAGDTGIKIGASVPAGCTIRMNRVGTQNSGSSTVIQRDSTVNIHARLDNANTKIVKVTFLLLNGVTAGNFQLKWAQSTAVVANTTVKIGSAIIITKLS